MYRNYRFHHFGLWIGLYGRKHNNLFFSPGIKESPHWTYNDIATIYHILPVGIFIPHDTKVSFPNLQFVDVVISYDSKARGRISEID